MATSPDGDPVNVDRPNCDAVRGDDRQLRPPSAADRDAQMRGSTTLMRLHVACNDPSLLNLCMVRRGQGAFPAPSFLDPVNVYHRIIRFRPIKCRGNSSPFTLRRQGCGRFDSPPDFLHPGRVPVAYGLGRDVQPDRQPPVRDLAGTGPGAGHKRRSIQAA